ncbi:MAG: alpha/beta fold hydrolase, partial [Bacteroidales bacterium]|nr:alpha/beta fold hydrolase [Bacteroidales bacterium]
MNLFYREFGIKNKDTIIILHGLYGCSDNWISISKQIEHRYRVIVPDLRNHGKSPHSDDHNFEIMANDIVSLIKKLAITKCHIIGHSMGGKLAMFIADSNPEIIDKLVVLDISPTKQKTEEKDEIASFHNHVLSSLAKINLSIIS